MRGYRTGDNPARWDGHLDQLLPTGGTIGEVVHHAALPYIDVPGFIANLRQRHGTHTLLTISPRVEPYRCAPRPPPRAIAQRFSALAPNGHAGAG